MKSHIKIGTMLVLATPFFFSIQTLAAKPSTTPPLTITNLIFDASHNDIASVSGQGFNSTTTANIELAAGGTLYEVALTVLSDSTDTVLHVQFPGGAPPAGSYGLLVKNAMPAQAATFDFTVGTVGPKGDKGDPGDPGATQLNQSVTVVPATYEISSGTLVGSIQTLSANCGPADSTVILTGGGFYGADPDKAAILSSAPFGKTWEVRFRVLSNTESHLLTAYAICLDLSIQ